MEAGWNPAGTDPAQQDRSFRAEANCLLLNANSQPRRRLAGLARVAYHLSFLSDLSRQGDIALSERHLRQKPDEGFRGAGWFVEARDR